MNNKNLKIPTKTIKMLLHYFDIIMTSSIFKLNKLEKKMILLQLKIKIYFMNLEQLIFFIRQNTNKRM